MADLTVEDALKAYDWYCYTQGHRQRFQILADEVLRLRAALAPQNSKIKYGDICTQRPSLDDSDMIDDEL